MVGSAIILMHYLCRHFRLNLIVRTMSASNALQCQQKCEAKQQQKIIVVSFGVDRY